MFHLTLIAAFLALPGVVPRTISTPLGGLFLFEPFMLGALAVTLVRRGSIVPKALYVFTCAAALAVTIGLEAGNSKIPMISDIRPLIDVLLGVVVGANALRFTSISALIRTSKWVLWVSLCITLAGSLFGLELTGRSEVASLTGATDGAERLITPATYFALAVACAAVAAVISRRITVRSVLPLGLPALVIIFLSFSRNNILALGVAFIWAVIASGPGSRKASGVGRLISVAALGAAGVIAVTTVFNIPWLQEQLDGFSSRVLDGLTSSGLETDGSALFRVGENEQIWPVINESPLWGHGFGAAYKAPYGPSDYFTATTAPYYAHQYYYWLMLKGGAVLLAAFTLLVLLPVLKSLWSRIPDLTIASAVTLAFAVVSTVAPMPNGFPTGALFGLMLGAAYYYYYYKDGTITEASAPSLMGMPLTEWAKSAQSPSGMNLNMPSSIASR